MAHALPIVTGPLIVVAATRTSQSQFEENSPLARSLKRVGQLTPLSLRLYSDNRLALGTCYNQAIDEAPRSARLIFVHDDVFIDDWMAGARVIEALQQFDVVGVAGNMRRQHGQETWYLKPGREVDGVRHVGDFDHPHLSGAVAHGAPGTGAISTYGPAPARVRMIDGVLIAARADRLHESGVRFDPSFGFHLYDLDFCRSAERAGLSLGTWPIAVTHFSRGESVQSQEWAAACNRYLAKYGEG